MKMLLEKVKSILPARYLRGAVVSAVLMVALAISAFAEDPPSATASISAAMQSSFSTIISDTMTMVGAILPTALTLVGAMLLIGVGIKAFKKMVNKAN